MKTNELLLNRKTEIESEISILQDELKKVADALLIFNPIKMIGVNASGSCLHETSPGQKIEIKLPDISGYKKGDKLTIIGSNKKEVPKIETRISAIQALKKCLNDNGAVHKNFLKANMAFLNKKLTKHQINLCVNYAKRKGIMKESKLGMCKLNSSK